MYMKYKKKRYEIKNTMARQKVNNIKNTRARYIHI